MVHAKAPDDSSAWAAFRDKAFDLFSEHLYDEAEASRSTDELIFSFDLDDSEAPHYAWPIIVEPSYFAFDPPELASQLTEPSYRRAYGFFLKNLAERLEFE